MDVFLARQPIFDQQNDVIAYELLFRNNLNNFFTHADPLEATSHLIADSFLLFGVEKLTDGKPAFINVTREVLVEDSVSLLPKKFYAAEVTEDVQVDKEVIAACRSLKNKGYTIVLDDFVFRQELMPLVDLADIIKIDILAMNREEQLSILSRFGNGKIHFLAEKVETPEEYQIAKEMGYVYFQGFFFSKPVIISKKDIPGVKLHYLQLLQEINRSDINITQLEEVIKRDVSLTYHLMRYINSPFFGLRNEIRSIQHALVVLGEKEVRKWACLIALGRMGDDKPEELLVSILIRARICEGLADLVGMKDRRQDLFLMGMFSLIHVIIGRPIDEILTTIPLANDIKNALTGQSNLLAKVLALVVAYEKGDWRNFAGLAATLKLDEDKMPEQYIQAVEWAHQNLQI